MDRPMVVVNPSSAGGRTSSVWGRIASDMAIRFGPFDCCFTKARGDASRLAKQAAIAGRRLVVACGGDGTISEVASGIIESGSDCELGILPSGTGGDFRRTLEIPTRTADAVKVLKDGKSRRIDAGRVTYFSKSGKEETRYFIGVASFGMSGDVIERVKKERSPWMSALPSMGFGGKAAFARAMLETTLRADSKSVVIGIDDAPGRAVNVTNFCVANARYFGGGMKIAPKALVDDGFLDVIEIADMHAARILLHSPRLYSGSHLSIDKIEHQLARVVTARPLDDDDRVLLEVDGELPGYLPARFEIIPRALSVRCR